MQLLSKLNASVEKMVTNQEETKNTFLAQQERNPRGQNSDSSSGGTKHKQANVVTILRSGKTLERDYHLPTPIVEVDEEEDEMEGVREKRKVKRENG